MSTAYHGRTHSQDGTDPIPVDPENIRFDTDNQGGYLYVTTNDEGPVDTFSGTPLGLLFIDTSQDGLRIRNVYGGQTAQLLIGNGQNIAMTANNFIRLNRTGGPTIELNSTGIAIDINSGQKLTVTIPGGASAFEIWDDGSVHIGVGQTIVADLT